MLLKFFKRGGSDDNRRTLGGSAVKTYLLGTDEKPRENARILLGDPEEDTEIINGLTYAKVYTSGCLSFREDEHINEEQKYEMIEYFEKMVFVGLEPHQYTSYWVEHTDKGRLELNFVFPNVELTSGKSLQVYYHPRDKNLFNAWKNLTNDKYGLINPEDLENRREVSPSIGPNILADWQHSDKQTLLEKFQRYQSVEDFKTDITALVLSEVDKKSQQGHPVSSQDNVASILRDLGFEISRQGKDSISIKNPDPSKKNIKLKGLIYERDVNADVIDYVSKRKNDLAGLTADKLANDEINNETNDFINAYKKQRTQEAERTFSLELEKRRQRHLKRYQLPDHDAEFVLPNVTELSENEIKQPPIQPVLEGMDSKLPTLRNHQWHVATTHQFNYFIQPTTRAIHDISQNPHHNTTTRYRQLEDIVSKFGGENREQVGAESDRTASTDRPSPFAFNTDIVSTAVTHYRRGNKKTNSAHAEPDGGLLDRIKDYQQRTKQNAQIRQRRISNLTAEDDNDFDPISEFVATRRKRHRYLIERFADFNEPMSDNTSNHDERTSDIKPINRRLRNLKSGYADHARKLKTTTDEYGKLAGTVYALVEAMIAFFKQLFEGLKQKALGYAGEGLLYPVKQDGSQESQATMQEAKQETRQEIKDYVNNHPYDLSGYAQLKQTVANWDKQKQENEHKNQPTFNGFGR